MVMNDFLLSLILLLFNIYGIIPIIHNKNSTQKKYLKTKL